MVVVVSCVEVRPDAALLETQRSDQAAPSLHNLTQHFGHFRCLVSGARQHRRKLSLCVGVTTTNSQTGPTTATLAVQTTRVPVGSPK